MASALTQEEKQKLLQLAREAVECAACSRKLPTLDPAALTPALAAAGASFVTLTKRGELRGCLGALEAYQPLAADVREHAVAAALQDYRFPPVDASEVAELCIEISRLTPPEPLAYTTPEELLTRLRPGLDGVILSADRWHRATFLPQVWEKVPDPASFLDHLCEKMGLPVDTWRTRHLEVKIYQVEEFQE
jgi:AmmeMemoRadiSam system protein A